MAVLILTLAACSSAVTPPAAPETSAPFVTAQPESSSTPTADSATFPLTQTCGQLVSLKTLYDFNPNVGPISAFTPQKGSNAETAVTKKGVACLFQNQSSGQTIELSVAQLSPAALESLNLTLQNSSQISAIFDPETGVSGFFQVENGVGTAQVVTDKYWVTAQSADFYEPLDASVFLTSALHALATQ